ncbi:MAG: hypothetical protein U0324_32870 [Polyangiales bacterium]
MTPHFTAVTFTVDEGRALDVLAALLGRRRAEGLPPPAGDAPPSRALLAAGSDRIARGVARYLTHEGGHRERPFLRDGRRVTGRAWDARLGEGFVPRFTVASRDLWLRGAKHLPALASLEPSSAGRSRERLVQQTVAVAGTASGDWIFYAMVLGSIRGFLLPADDERAVVRRLCLGSPLATLLDAEPEAPDGEVRARLAPLASPEHARAVECVESRLAAAWLARARAHGHWRIAHAQLLWRWTALGNCLHAWLDVIDAARRADLARPLLTFSAGLATEVFAAGAEAARAAVGSAPGARSVDDRERLLAAVARVAGVGVRLLRLRDRLALERYGDERHAEGQLFVGDADRILAPARRPTEALARALTGAVG